MPRAPASASSSGRAAANFVMVRVGDTAPVVEALAAKHIHVRDRSKDPTTPGCIRITAGIVDHTSAAIEALEAVMAPSTQPSAGGKAGTMTKTPPRRTTARRPGSGRARSGDVRPPHGRDADSRAPGHRRSRTVRCTDRHQVPRSHARAVLPARRIRSLAPRGRGSRCRPAPHRRGRRHRARRGGPVGARRSERHQPRGLLPDADGTRRWPSPPST